MGKKLVRPVLKALKKLHTAHADPKKQAPGKPPKPAELDQDPGGGYNANRTFPQT